MGVVDVWSGAVVLPAMSACNGRFSRTSDQRLSAQFPCIGCGDGRHQQEQSCTADHVVDTFLETLCQVQIAAHLPTSASSRLAP